MIFANNTYGDIMDYTKRLYDLRTDNDLRQEDVAQVLNITSQAYGMYENGKRSLPIEHLKTLAKFYKENKKRSGKTTPSLLLLYYLEFCYIICNYQR